MNGITQKGNVEVTGNSVEFGYGGTIIFGNPYEVSAICPGCDAKITADKRELQKYT